MYVTEGSEIHQAELTQAELTQGRLDSGADLTSGPVDPLPLSYRADGFCYMSYRGTIHSNTFYFTLKNDIK